MGKLIGKAKLEFFHTFSGEFREDFEILFHSKGQSMSYKFSIPREEIDMIRDPNEVFSYHCARGMKEFIRQSIDRKIMKSPLTKLKVVK